MCATLQSRSTTIIIVTVTFSYTTLSVSRFSLIAAIIGSIVSSTGISTTSMTMVGVGVTKRVTKRPIKQGESEEILNMAFCDTLSIDRFQTAEVGHNYGSHHHTVMVKIPLKGPSKREHRKKTDLKKADWELYKQVLDDLLPNPDDATITSTNDINLLVRLVTEAIQTANLKAIPRTKYKSILKNFLLPYGPS
jgi:hypothetical protein